MVLALDGFRVLELGHPFRAMSRQAFAGMPEVITIGPLDGGISRAHGPFKDGVPQRETIAPQRRGNHMASFIGIYPRLDGHLGIPLVPRNWQPFCEAEYPGPPWWVGPEGWRFERVPLLGEHNEEVLGTVASRQGRQT